VAGTEPDYPAGLHHHRRLPCPGIPRCFPFLPGVFGYVRHQPVRAQQSPQVQTGALLQLGAVNPGAGPLNQPF
tara:strand:+ start:116591 stop:116809 length:219 start_codon:yes stop_codon:yes gene_type:complete